MALNLIEKEHNARAVFFKGMFTAEKLAEFLHLNYRAAAKSFHVGLGCPFRHDHGWNSCGNKEYFRRRAQWLMEPLKNYNGQVGK